jgi:uncharacterized protein
MMGKLNRWILICVILVFTGLSLFYTSKNLKFEETFSSILPVDNQNKFLVELLDSASFFDRMVVHIFTPDSIKAQPDVLVEIAGRLSDSIRKAFIPEYIESIEGKTRFDIQNVLFANFVEYLPTYLTDKDYKRIDSLIGSGDLKPLVQEQLKILNSPAGFMAAKYLFADPLGIISKQFERLKSLQVDQNLIIYKNYLLSKDKRHLTFFLLPTDATNTGKNAVFVEELNKSIAGIRDEYKQTVFIEYTGSLPIAAANAQQIKSDIQTTVNIAIVAIVLLIFYFYRRWQYLGLILLPAFIGATIAITFFAFHYGKISAISLGIGSVLLGISVDYALHIFTHLKHSGNIKSVIKDITLPILMASITTGSAFLGLLSLSSPALRQLGIFAAISVMASALFAVFVLPLLLKEKSAPLKLNKNTFIEKIAGFETNNKLWNVLVIIVLTAFFIVFIPRVRFEEDFEKLNYMPTHLQHAVENLDKAGDFSGKKSYLLSEGENTSEALDNAYNGIVTLDSLMKCGIIESYNTMLPLVSSKSIQTIKTEQWNSFWSDKKIGQFTSLLNEAATYYHIKPEAYNKFLSVINRKYHAVSPDSIISGFDNITSSFKLTGSSKVYIAHVIHLDDANRKLVSSVFQADQKNHLIDKKVFISSIFDNLQKDFHKLLYISLLLVFAIILVFMGRIELAIITFLPILVSWLWTLGMIGLFGIKLNFFNIVICSLIFGLGIDYSIFITRGLVQKYKTGQDNLRSYKSSILISAFTTLVGLGVLLFAKHPALKSIALLAIVGILSSVIITFSLQAILFRFLVGSDRNKRIIPVSMENMLHTIITFGAWGVGAGILSGILPVIIILPVRKKIKQHIIRYSVSKICWSILFYHPRSKFRKVNFQNLDLNTPSVIVSNHQSMVDILLYLSLSPNILLLTKDWVWNNPLFGLVVRYSGHINVSKGYDNLHDIIQNRIAEGCSIVVFPEGSRTQNGHIKRFHKGGFFLAEQNSLPLHKLVVHGLYDFHPRGSVTLSQTLITIKYISTHTFTDPNKNSYSKVSKQSCAEIRKAYDEIKKDPEVIRNYRYRIIQNFIYKGPVLEHYVRIKLRLEENYLPFHKLVPERGKIYDIGCGYGIMPMMLKQLSEERDIVAIDYDEEKIETAKNTQLNSELGIHFISGDALKLNIENADAIILSDMLHYLKPEEQLELFSKCVERLNINGKLIIRDGDASKIKRHKGTRMSEFFSTNLGFNKTRNKLNFFTSDFIKSVALKNKLHFEIIDQTKHTSNLIYVLSKNED